MISRVSHRISQTCSHFSEPTAIDLSCFAVMGSNSIPSLSSPSDSLADPDERPTEEVVDVGGESSRARRASQRRVRLAEVGQRSRNMFE